MKKLNQGGFSVIEGVLIFIIVAIIAGAGVYVYKANQDFANNVEKASTVQQKEKKLFTEKNLGNGYIEYCSNKEKACFDYPEDWQRKSDVPISDEEYFKDADSATFTSPNGSNIVWYSAVDGLGGACEKNTTRPNVVITKVSQPKGASHLAVIRSTQEGVIKDNIAMVNFAEDGKEIETGDTGECILIPAFSSMHEERTLQFGDIHGEVKPEDRDAVEKILLSFRY